MVLDRFFKPKWQHKKAEIRLQAVAQLNCKNTDHLNILKNLAKGDKHPQVRQAAVKQIGQIQELDQLLQSHPDAQLHNWVIEQLSLQLSSKNASHSDESKKLQYTQSCPHQEILQHVALNGQIPEVQLAAIQGLENEQHLIHIATNASSANHRYAAAQKVESEQGLREISRCIKNKDKKVYRLAKSKLHEIEKSDQEKSLRLKSIEQLLVNLSKLSESAYSPQYNNRLTAIKVKWEEFDDSEKAPFADVYQPLFSHCENIITQAQSALSIPESQEDDNAEQEQLATCEALETCTEEIKTLIKQNALDEPSLIALLKTQKNRWEVAGQQQTPTAEIKKRYLDTLGPLEEILSAKIRLNEKVAQINDLVATNHLDCSEHQLQNNLKLSKQIINYINWPRNFDLPPTLEQLNSLQPELENFRREQHERNKKRIDQLQRKLENLNHSIDQGNLKQAQKISQDIKKELAELAENKQTRQITKAHHSLQGRLKELRDWQNFATSPKKEQLIQAMEALIDADIDAEDKANQIQKLQQEWKALGASDPKTAQAQWQRFKDAADKAYLPCKAHYAEQKQQRLQNLEKRISICEQLETFVEEVNWNGAQWKNVEEIHQLARKEWQQYSPVERVEGRKVQQRFDQVLQQINTQLQLEKDRNGRKKQTLIEQAKTLLEEPNLNSAIESIKNLQSQWKNIGLVDYRHDRAQWKEFRSICDQVFARREQARNEKRAEEQSQIELANSLSEQLADLCQGSANEIIANEKEASRLAQQFKELTQLPNGPKKSIEKQFRTRLSEFNKSLQRSKQEQRYTQLNIARQCGEICQQLEQLNIVNPAPQNKEEISTQWPAEYVALDSAWQEVLIKRRDHALAAPQPEQDSLLQNLEPMENICIGMEILSNIDSPSQSLEKRMAYQVNRLSKGLGQNGENQSPMEQMMELELAWLAHPWLDHPDYENLATRYKNAIDKFYAMPQSDRSNKKSMEPTN